MPGKDLVRKKKRCPKNYISLELAIGFSNVVGQSDIASSGPIRIKPSFVSRPRLSMATAALANASHG